MANTEIREMTPEERNRATVRYKENRMSEEVREITLQDVVGNQQVIVNNQTIIDKKLDALLTLFKLNTPVAEAPEQEES